MQRLFTLRSLYATIAFVSIVLISIFLKPPFLFDEHGNLKHFGFSQNQTYFALSTICFIFPILFFIMFALFDLWRQNKKMM